MTPKEILQYWSNWAETAERMVHDKNLTIENLERQIEVLHENSDCYIDRINQLELDLADARCFADQAEDNVVRYADEARKLKRDLALEKRLNSFYSAKWVENADIVSNIENVIKAARKG